jgi:hypothetical protein
MGGNSVGKMRTNVAILAQYRAGSALALAALKWWYSCSLVSGVTWLMPQIVFANSASIYSDTASTAKGVGRLADSVAGGVSE